MIQRVVTGMFCLLVLAGCSHGEKHTPNPYKDVIASEPESHIVEIKQMKFEPAELKIQRGDNVTWINHDILVHDVTEQSSKAWSSGPMDVGASWSKTFTTTTDYYCSIHVVMKGRIVVE